MDTSETALPTSTRVGRVALRVNDVGREADFYRNVVGLPVLRRGEDAVVLGSDEPVFELVADPTAPERGEHETGLFHVAFRVPSRAALADALARVRDRWTLDGASDHLVSEALYLRDPEDNGVEIYRDRPRSEWPIEADGTVGMETLPLDVEALDRETTGATSVPEGTTVGHVHLEVSDLAAAERFYADGLGLEVRARYGDAAVFVAAGDYHHHVGLNTWNDRRDPPTGRGLEEFELVVPTRAALEAVHARLAERGVETEPTGGGVRVADPDGIDLVLRVAA